MFGRPVPVLAAAVVVALAGCAPAVETTEHAGHVTLPSETVRRAAPSPPDTAQPRLASEPAQLADDLVDDERALRDRASSEAVLVAAARRQQVAYRALGRHPDWDAIVRPRIAPDLLDAYDRNVDACRQLEAMSGGRGKPTVPAWRINASAPAGELLDIYHEAEAASGVGWNYLAAINLVESAFGRISGVSTAGAQGPMQFMPSTFAIYGRGDILAVRDSIAAAGRFLAAHGFARDRDQAIFRYNNSRNYVRAVDQYATVIGAQPAAFAAYYRWDVYYNTAAGDVVLPVGYVANAPIPVVDYLATHPQ